MADTRRQVILAAFAGRLSAITRTAGFNTDAGAAVYLGETPQLGPDDPDEAIAIVVEDDAVNDQGFLFVDLPVSVQALAKAKADLTAPWLAVEAILGDIKRAIETPTDRTLGALLKRQMTRGTTRTLPREPGSLTVGAAVTYLCPHVETWGDP